MDDLVYRRPRKANQFGTYPLAGGGALMLQIPSVLFQLVTAAVALPLIVLGVRAWSTTVTAEGITTRSFRRRVIPWTQVEAVTATASAGDRSVEVRLADGSRHRLPAPVERHWRSHDPDFDDKYNAIVAAWLRSSAPVDAEIRPGG